MGFITAIKTVFSKYVVFQGRARRSEFWWWVLFVWIVTFIANLLDGMLNLDMKIMADENGVMQSVPLYSVGWISIIVALALFLPSVAVSVRRLHDIDRTGWWWWLGFVCCVGPIVLLIFHLLPSTPGENRYGPQEI